MALAGARRPLTPILLGGFFALGAVLTLSAGLSLLRPGGGLQFLWRWKRAEQAQLLAFGPAAGAGFLLLGGILAAASYGCLRRRRWGRLLAIGVIAANGIGDALRIASDPAAGLTGVSFAGLIILWLSRPALRLEWEPEGQ